LSICDNKTHFKLWQKLLEDSFFPPINVLLCKKIIPTYFPRIRVFSRFTNLWALRFRLPLCRSGRWILTEDSLEGVVAIHGNQHLEN